MTIAEVARIIGAPLSTVRLYRDEFEEYVPCRGQGRKRRYEAEGIDVLRRIVAWKRDGWAGSRIREELARERLPRERVRRRTNEERLDEALLLLTAQAGEIAMLRSEVSALRGAMNELSSAVRAESAPPPRFEEALTAAMGEQR